MLIQVVHLRSAIIKLGIKIKYLTTKKISPRKTIKILPSKKNNHTKYGKICIHGNTSTRKLNPRNETRISLSIYINVKVNKP